MNNLVYLLLALVVSALGLAVLWFRTRDNTSPTSSVEEFSGKMNALAPDDDTQPVSRRRGA